MTLPAEDHHDVAIVGAGAAGVSCALECFDIQLDTVLFEAEEEAGGQLSEIPHSIRNVAAGRYENGAALRGALAESSGILGPRLRLSQPVSQVDLGERSVEVDGARVFAKALVLATGTAHQQLAPAVDGSFGGDVTYQPDSHWDESVRRDVIVIGGGDSATLDALQLARAGSRVKLVHRSAALTARDDITEQLRRESRIDDLAGWELESLHGGERLEEAVLRGAGGQHLRLRADGVVVKIARVPRTQLFRGQLDLGHGGAIVVDRELRTSREGVFAAGDVVADAYARVAVALGQGVLAARSVLRYLQARR